MTRTRDSGTFRIAASAAQCDFFPPPSLSAGSPSRKGVFCLSLCADDRLRCFLATNMLRPFSFDDRSRLLPESWTKFTLQEANDGTKPQCRPSTQQSNRLPRPTLTRRTSDLALPVKPTPAAGSAAAGEPTPSPPPAQPPATVAVGLRGLDAFHPDFVRVARHALRFTNGSGEPTVPGWTVLGVQELLHAPATRDAFAARRQHLFGRQFPVVSKFLIDGGADGREALSRRVVMRQAGRFWRGDMTRTIGGAPAPCGDAFYFPNLYSEADESLLPKSEAYGGNASSTTVAGGARHPAANHLHLVLCDVAPGSTWMPRPGLARDAAVLGGSPVQLRQFLIDQRFDSMTIQAPRCDVAGDLVAGRGSLAGIRDNGHQLVVFADDAILPTHLVSLSWEAAATCGGGDLEGNAVPRPDPTPAADPAPAQDAGLRLSPNELEAGAREKIAAHSRQLQLAIRQQFRDLEESARARKEFLLAAMRRTEEAALLDVSSRAAALAASGAEGPDALRAAVAALSAPVTSLQLSTGAALAAIEGVCLQRPPASRARDALSRFGQRLTGTVSHPPSRTADEEPSIAAAPDAPRPPAPSASGSTTPRASVAATVRRSAANGTAHPLSEGGLPIRSRVAPPTAQSAQAGSRGLRNDHSSALKVRTGDAKIAPQQDTPSSPVTRIVEV